MLSKLTGFNFKMGVLHLVQGLAMLVLALTVSVFVEYRPEIVGRFFGPLGNGFYGPVETVLFELPFSILVATFLLLSAVFHFLIAVPFKNRYLKNISQGINSLRWYEYALSSSIMIVLLATMFGITTIEGILGIFFINAVMNLLGLLMEKMNPPTRTKTDWSAHIIGWVAGLVPWLLIVIYLFSIGDITQLPWFVIPGLLFYFLVFNLFAFNQILQYKKIGPWKDYVFGEVSYVVLSLVGKSVLAWFVFIGVLLA
jgi:hypothetical protein